MFKPRLGVLLKLPLAALCQRVGGTPPRSAPIPRRLVPFWLEMLKREGLRHPLYGKDRFLHLRFIMRLHAPSEAVGTCCAIETMNEGFASRCRPPVSPTQSTEELPRHQGPHASERFLQIFCFPDFVNFRFPDGNHISIILVIRFCSQ